MARKLPIVNWPKTKRNKKRGGMVHINFPIMTALSFRIIIR